MERFPTLVASSPRRVKEKNREPVQDIRGAVPKGNPEERDLIILLLHEKLDSQHIQALQSHMFRRPRIAGLSKWRLSMWGMKALLILRRSGRGVPY